jgi:hypothetical protein
VCPLLVDTPCRLSGSSAPCNRGAWRIIGGWPRFRPDVVPSPISRVMLRYGVAVARQAANPVYRPPEFHHGLLSVGVPIDL